MARRLTPAHGTSAVVAWPWLGNLLGMCNFITKAVLGVTFMIWLRWTLPRLRIDQVMTTCLKYCVPLGSAMLAGVMLWMCFLPEGAIVELRRAYAALTRTEPQATRLHQERPSSAKDFKFQISNFKFQIDARPGSDGLPEMTNLQFAICNLQSSSQQEGP